ncbi:3-hydroxylacyl-ACP dehydratase [Noviherbaspirillum aridicola]|uniref:Phosphotransferase n=1 Tax=Noviherbaspirillum aridicola TaxID=2849687 RepID=A0ABQ4Q5S4_9BURK|nr:3-hydroxylacyl-ACP dehydratase [Noviherbaspirillum aridicola]GIZ52557.1 phosphotransferase [Noviherbaspirillum aridicola]
MQLDRDWIAARIPHQHDMLLLDRVESWSGQGVRCAASSHRDSANPLRARGRLAAVCGVEYAAQAMAVHGALDTLGALGAENSARPRAGYLVSLRNVQLHVARLDDIAGELAIEVQRFSGDGNSVLYDFSVQGDGKVLLEGRAAVVIDAGHLIGA